MSYVYMLYSTLLREKKGNKRKIDDTLLLQLYTPFYEFTRNKPPIY